MSKFSVLRWAGLVVMTFLTIMILWANPRIYAGDYQSPIPDYECKASTGQKCPAWDDGNYCILNGDGTYSGTLYYCDVSTSPSECTAKTGSSCEPYKANKNNDANACGFRLDCDGQPIYDGTVQIPCTQHFSLCK